MPKDLDELRQRKEELLLESEINRQIVALEMSQLRLKSVEWKKGLTRAGTLYKWIAPLAGVGLGFFTARKQVRKSHVASRLTGNGHGGSPYLKLLAPLGISALRQAFMYLRQKRAARGADL